MFGLSPEKDPLSTYRKLLTDWEEEKIKILVGVYVKLFVR